MILTAIGLIYFPFMAYVIVLWAFNLSLSVYGVVPTAVEIQRRLG